MHNSEVLLGKKKKWNKRRGQIDEWEGAWWMGRGSLCVQFI